MKVKDILSLDTMLHHLYTHILKIFTIENNWHFAACFCFRIKTPN